MIKSFIGNTKAWMRFSSTSKPRKVLKQKLIVLKSYLNKNPKLKTTLIHILEYVPAIKKRLQNVGKVHQNEYTHHAKLTESLLSPEEKIIYSKLKAQQIIHNENL